MNIFRRLERLVIMMAMFFSQRVILGKTEFDAVPKALKKQVGPARWFRPPAACHGFLRARRSRACPQRR